MAYGQLAGVTPVAGLYGAIAALVSFAIFGYYRKLIVGPESAVAILTASSVAAVAVSGTPAQYAAMVAVVSILCGAFALLAGFLRLGFLANFVSGPVLVGYLVGVAGIIIASQLGKIFGIKVPSGSFISEISYFLTHLNQTNIYTLAVGIFTIALILAMKRYLPRIPSALVVVVVLTIASFVLDFQSQGISILGKIPAGLPALTIPNVNANVISGLIPGALSISVVSYADVVLTSRAFAEKDESKTNPDQDLIGLGVAQIVSGIFQGIPATGSQSRTEVNYQAGGKTQIVGLVAAGILCLFLLFLTTTLYFLPNVALGAIIIVAATGLIERRHIKRAYDYQKIEFTLLVISAVGVLLFGIVPGLLLAAILSITVMIAKISKPHDSVLGKTRDVDGFHSLSDPNQEEAEKGLIVYRFEAPLFFGNSDRLITRVNELIDQAKDPIRWIILNAISFGEIDLTAVESLETLLDELKKRDVTLVIARAEKPLMDEMKKSGLYDRIGRENFFATVTDAVEAYNSRIPVNMRNEASERFSLP